MLLELDRGDYIHHFQRKGITDRKLPIDPYALRQKFSAEGDLPEKFNQKQWSYCPHKFGLHGRLDVLPEQIIPICNKERISTKGGTATISMIEVQEEFVEDNLRKVVLTSRYNNAGDFFGWRYQFTLKTFHGHNLDRAANEIEAFLILKEHDGMVQYLAEYAHVEPKHALTNTHFQPQASGGSVSTANILLEYGERDLEEYFEQCLPPILQVEIEDFWKDLFNVADAVRRIHDFEKVKAGVSQEYYGWHADIKPDNILSVQGKFKLADPGFARFMEKADKHARMNIDGGTITYGAPECYPRESLVSRAIDVWSLGCVFSMAATWVVLGSSGTRQYNKLRQGAIMNIIRQQQIRATPKDQTSYVRKGDFFHDGGDVLEDIQLWHTHLRRLTRKTDTITAQVLDLVDQDMLRGKADDRMHAKALCARLETIMKNSHDGRREEVPGSIMRALLEVEKDADPDAVFARATAMAPQLPFLERKDRKSSLLELPFQKTTHRSDWLNSALHQTDINPAPLDITIRLPRLPREETASPVRDLLRSNMPPEVRGRHQGTPHSPEGGIEGRISPESRQQSHFDSDVSVVRHLASGTSSEHHESQDVFQARGDMQRRKGPLIWRSRSRRDEILSRHFGHRDIKFIVDNAVTMERFWDETTNLLEVLTMKAKGQDKNGMDLYFTTGTVKLENSHDPSKFVAKMADQNAKPMKGTHTDMRHPLSDLLGDYLRGIRRTSPYAQLGGPKKLTLIILTDGKWHGMTNRDDVSTTIVDFLQRLEKMVPSFKSRPVSIQFIQLGDDAEATYRLRLLDNELPHHGVPDVVDYEHSRGDVNKMLLGSFVEEYDEKDEQMQIPPTSPPSRVDSFATTPATVESFSADPSPGTSPTQPPTRPQTVSNANERRRTTSIPPMQPLRTIQSLNALDYSHQ